MTATTCNPFPIDEKEFLELIDHIKSKKWTCEYVMAFGNTLMIDAARGSNCPRDVFISFLRKSYETYSDLLTQEEMGDFQKEESGKD